MSVLPPAVGDHGYALEAEEGEALAQSLAQTLAWNFELLENGGGDPLHRPILCLEERQRVAREAEDLGRQPVQVLLDGDGDVPSQVVGEGPVDHIGRLATAEMRSDALVECLPAYGSHLLPPVGEARSASRKNDGAISH